MRTDSSLTFTVVNLNSGTDNSRNYRERERQTRTLEVTSDKGWMGERIVGT